MPVRTHFGIAQKRDEALLDALGDRVLETARFRVHFIPRQSQDLREKTLRESVTAQYAHRDLEAATREFGFAARAMIDVAVGRKLLEHPRNGCGCDTESRSKRRRRDARPFPFQTVDRFEIFFC